MDDWISSKATVDLRPGGEYRFGWTETRSDGAVVPAGPIEILAIEQDRLLKTSWRYGTETPTQVEWTIEGEGGSTTVRLTHSGFGPADDVPGYAQGWAAFLCILKAMLEIQARVKDAA